MLVKELIQIQKEKGLADEQFAESLAIHKQSWYRIKRTRLIGSAVLLKAFEVYPELRDRFLNSFDTTEALEVNATDITTAPTFTNKNQRESPLKRLWDILYLKFIKRLRN